MALPRQVQKQIEEIEALEKQMQAPANEESEDSDTPKMEVVSEQTTDADEIETSDAPVAEEPKQPRTSDVSEETWEHKYHRLQGKYDAEVPRLHAQLKELSQELNALREETRNKPVQNSAVEDKAVQKLVTDADVEEYGEEFIDLQRRIAREAIRDEVDSLKAENAQLKKQISQTDSDVGATKFQQQLDKLVPDFVELNQDPNWIEWLDEVDPMLRVPRRAIAQQVLDARDAEGLANIVKVFRGSNTPEVQENSSRKAELARQVQPTKSVSSKTPVSQKGRNYTVADIDKMFQKVIKLNSMQKFDEAQKLEAEIDSAYRDGRVAV